MSWIERLETIPSLYRWAIAPVLFLLLGGTYWNVVHQPRDEALAVLQEGNASRARQWQRQRVSAAQIKELEDAVAALRTELAQHLQFLPRRQGLPALIRRISDLGVHTGLRIDLLRPRNERHNELYAEMPITMELQGPYHAVAVFLDRLTALPGLIQVNQLDMRAAGRTTQCLATTFRYLGEDTAGARPVAARPGSGYDPQGRRDPMDPLVKETPPPAAPRRVERIPGAAREPLGHFDLAALKLVAIVRGGFGSKALVKAPDGKGHYVTVGTRMGRHGGRVSEIRDQALVIEEIYVTPENGIISELLTLPLRRRDGKGG
jgi:type IV pilus assembly protein PilO